MLEALPKRLAPNSFPQELGAIRFSFRKPQVSDVFPVLGGHGPEPTLPPAGM